ncbi:MAG TPA: type II toxin-antitoxin system RelE/ParE family toxin [Xanthobacteraceae bacterium]|nr:type II toxin-antitoxin system RelE/ParE family toxin [Xanthobacteraceae bacterium]
MAAYVLSPRALADIEEIWAYTEHRWDADQAERYDRILKEGIEQIAREPRSGRACDHLRRGYRKYAIGSHVAFFESWKGG